MKIAAIDLGSNSIHMVVVEVSAAGAFHVVDREAEMNRLGEGSLVEGELSVEAMRRTLAILKAYRKLAEIHQVEEILAVATAAIRESRNGEEFLQRVGRKVNIWPKIIPGDEEARLVYLAARHSIHVNGGRALVMDVGGGSLELALGTGPEPDLLVSEKLGLLRLKRRFLSRDPLPPREERRLVRQVRETLEPATDRIRRTGFELAIGTSGTVLALGRLALLAETGERPESLHHRTVSAEAFSTLRRRLVRMDQRQRLKVPALDRRRADIIAAGAVLLDTLMEMVGARNLTLCEWALREGLLLDYIRRHRSRLVRAEECPDIRRRSVLELAERCQYSEVHAQYVAKLALSLFDSTRRLHRLGPAYRALLEFAAFLHDVGHHIGHGGHHKHSYYLIKNGGLCGFGPQEVEILANVARYHRGGLPDRRHAGYAALPRAVGAKVDVLAGLLRLADGLDRSHRQRVRSLRVSTRGRDLTIHLHTSGEVELEMLGMQRRVGLLEKALGLRVRVEQARSRRTVPCLVAREASR